MKVCNLMKIPYYSPELCGLKIIKEVDTDESYEYNKIVIWQRLSDDSYWWDHDSGCSCPSPFSMGDHGNNLKPLNETFTDFASCVNNHYSLTNSEKHAFIKFAIDLNNLQTLGIQNEKSERDTSR